MKQTTLPGIRGGWPAELATYYEQETGGRLHPGRIGRALSPILRRWRRECPSNPWDYGPLDLMKLGFGRWARSERRRYGVEHFAANVGDFLRGPGL